MNSRQLYFMVILLVFGCISCKKYPEDHKISLQTAKKRLRAHQWFFNKLYINDADSTMTHLHNLIPNSNSTRDFSFVVYNGLNYKDDSGDIAYYFEYNPNLAYPDREPKSSVYLSKNKTKLKITAIQAERSTGLLIAPLWVYGRDAGNWEITKLTKTDLHFKSTYNNYEVKFEFVH